MKIYIPLWYSDPHDFENPFISTYTDEIKRVHPDVEFLFDRNIFWTEECEAIDVIHIMWPHIFAGKMVAGYDFEGRLKELKEKGVHVITTCHNLKSHVKRNECYDICYDMAFRNSDVIVHLGKYSKELQERQYPLAKHVLIPHHVYDNLYGQPLEKRISLKKLGCSPRYKYILCFGSFRNAGEYELLTYLGKKLKGQKIRILAPSIMKLPYGEWSLKAWISQLVHWVRWYRIGVMTNGRGFVPESDLALYYGASDICLIHRPEIFNSGNLPLGMYMGKVVVGPNMGNVGPLLAETGNPTFNPDDLSTLDAAIAQALKLAEEGKGEENRKYSLEHFTTAISAQLHYELYCDYQRG